MPELPEVETTRRGIAPHLEGAHIQAVVIRNPKLRWPIPSSLPQTLPGQRVREVKRRAKYLLISLETGTLLLHLGMSGSLRISPSNTPPEKHDHFDLVLSNQKVLRLRDPRRFGAVLWTEDAVFEHQLLQHLGPEPLSDAFDGEHLYQQTRKRRIAIKPFLMDAKIVVGVGNIYANEALFHSRIHPLQPVNKISRQTMAVLAQEVKRVLAAAIEQGGTTLQDFVREDGKTGYFQLKLAVYGKEQQACPVCATPIERLVIGQRASYFCPRCQKAPGAEEKSAIKKSRR